MLKLWADRKTILMLADVWLLATLSIVETCGPGRSYFQGRRAPRKMTPLVYKQHSPNLNENTLGASGPAEGGISRTNPEFKNLVTNNNPDIIFKNEEGTGADRRMSQRCSEKLNALAILVIQRWSDIKLRVTEGWDEDGYHSEDSLHYEGRAVDITTSDRDRTKYGMLARLAIEAGFDWVHYESRGHIHCSVKSDSSLAVTAGGCFPSSSKVFKEDWTEVKMVDLKVGDRIWTLDVTSSSPFLSQSPENSLQNSSSSSSSPTSSSSPLGRLHLTEVVTFLHRDPDGRMEFTTFADDKKLQTSLTTSANHLVYVTSQSKQSDVSIATSKNKSRDTEVSAIFADSLHVSNHKLLRVQPRSSDSRIELVNVELVNIELVNVVKVVRSRGQGIYAPMTSHGTLLVDGYLVSCYATVTNHNLAHVTLAPLRIWLSLTRWVTTVIDFIGNILDDVVVQYLQTTTRGYRPPINNTTDCHVTSQIRGVHPYARFLHWIADLVLDEEMLFRI